MLSHIYQRSIYVGIPGSLNIPLIIQVYNQHSIILYCLSHLTYKISHFLHIISCSILDGVFWKSSLFINISISQDPYLYICFLALISSSSLGPIEQFF
uniref:Uncharacterized protein n=1 Tax=Octopus bimaculoides TaxID=37653 RepID=A0A0L8HD45_OCTBM